MEKMTKDFIYEFLSQSLEQLYEEYMIYLEDLELNDERYREDILKEFQIHINKIIGVNK